MTMMNSTAIGLLAGLGLALGSLPAAAQQQEEFNSAVCDTDNNGYISADEAAACADQQYSDWVGEEESLSQERFGESFGPGGDESGTMYSEMDADGDGHVTREEWMAWRERTFTEAPGVTDQGMMTDYYRNWHLGRETSGEGGEGGGAGGSGGSGGGGG